MPWYFLFCRKLDIKTYTANFAFAWLWDIISYCEVRLWITRM